MAHLAAMQFKESKEANLRRGPALFGDKTEMQLAASEHQYKNLIARAYDPILTINRSGRIILVNEQLEKNFGYAAGELLGEQLEKLIPERFKDQHIKDRKGYFQSPRPRAMGVGLDLYGRRKDGSEFPVDISLSPTRGVTGLQVTAIIRDISGRKKFEDQQNFLASSSGILEETLNFDQRAQKIANAIVPKLADLCIVSILENERLRPSAVGVEELSRSHTIRSMISKAINLEGAASLFVFGTQGPVHLEVVSKDCPEKDFPKELRHLAETLKVNSYISLPLKAMGRVVGNLSLAMTNRQRHFSSDDLGFLEIVANRYAMSLENSRLYLEAQKAIAARENILAVVAHDLRTPVTAISMASEILEQTNLDATCIRDLALQMKNSAALMQRLIGDLLDFGKIEAGLFAVERNACSVQELVSGAVEQVKAKLEACNLRLDVDLINKLPFVSCDRSRVVQVLLNLIGNAVKFTPSGGSISVKAIAKEAFVQISIRDTGRGIDSEDLPRIFDKFWQARETAALGNGLGLSIAKGIVCAHGGKIWAESRVGDGSTFYFTIPVTDKKPCASESKLDRRVAERSLEGIHIMIVDDSPELLIVLTQVLRRAGAKVTAVRSLMEALSKLSQEKPNVMISDIEMEGGNGYELIKKVQEIMIREKIYFPIAALTGHTDENELRKISEAGFNAHLVKPAKTEQVISLVREMLNREERCTAV